jgi:hypothetical protein
MHTTIFHAVPALRWHCPANHFSSERLVLEYAREASATFRVAYTVRRVRKGTLRLWKRYPRVHVQVRA